MRTGLRALVMLGSISIALLAASCSKVGPSVDLTPTLRLKPDAHIGKSLTSDSTRIGDISDTFTPNETIFATVDVPGSTRGTVTAKWLFGTESVQDHAIEIMEGTNVYRFRLIPPAGGHRVGDYRFEVYIDGTSVEAENFKVQAG